MSEKRTTIYDIAEEFKVSASTITRALNGKAGVSEELRQQIVNRAAEMGYRTNRLAKSLTRGKIKIGVIINNRFPEFHGQVAEGARRAAEELADFNVEGEFVLLPRVDLYNRVVCEARRMADEGFNGIIIVPSGHHQYDAIIDELKERNIAVGSVIVESNHPDMVFSVYPNSLRAGMLAADLFNVAGMKRGDEILIAIGFEYLAIHQRCVEGFKNQNEHYGFKISSVIHHYDEPEVAYQLIKQCLIEMPTIKGIYCGTAVTASICKAIADLGRDDIRVVGTEITQNLLPYLESGMAIATLFQDPIQQGKKAFKAMYEYLENGVVRKGPDIEINPKIVLPANYDFYNQSKYTAKE